MKRSGWGLDCLGENGKEWEEKGAEGAWVGVVITIMEKITAVGMRISYSVIETS